MKKLHDFLEDCTEGIVATDNKGVFAIYSYDEFFGEIVPHIKKVDYIGCDLAIVILNNGLGLRVEAL